MLAVDFFQNFPKTVVLTSFPLFLFSFSVVSNSFATPWTVAHWAPLSIGISRQEYWSGLPFPSLGDLLDPWGSNPCLFHWQADSSSSSFYIFVYF